MVLPSGDHVGCVSCAGDRVTCTAVAAVHRLHPDVEVARLVGGVRDGAVRPATR